MINKYFGGTIIKPSNFKSEYSSSLLDVINDCKEKAINSLSNFRFQNANIEIWNIVRRANKYIDETAPWVLAKDENLKDRLETVIYNLLESIRVCGLILNPFLTITSEEIAKQINNDNKELKYLDDNSYELDKPTALFMRIDTKKE